ncbi:hypothetical protein DdX_14801 [Ditylenchus destructor]|uniref:F-box domain-containing protein n=1 Tax=Ditylenchus destructor TaxID=166010 RepID=A0AAD4R1M0_9BILA|nr:hypothetical protein DdX_14801 [Ditylenchus destructor]
MDNGTMLEVFKFLNYWQLAKNSLVSKKFSLLISYHRYSLARLSVEFSLVSLHFAYGIIKIFDKELTVKAYDEWVVRNNFSKQVPFGSLVAAGNESTHFDYKGYQLRAHADYKNITFPQNCRQSPSKTSVFIASTSLNHETWPIFQHFLRLFTDPFIFIQCIRLGLQKEVLNLLAVTLNPLPNSLQCKELAVCLRGDVHESFGWIKDYLLCKEFQINGHYDSYYDEDLLDFFVTGVQCTSVITIRFYYVSTVVVNFVQKFMRLKRCDEYHLVRFIKAYQIQNDQVLWNLQSRYEKFIVQKERFENDCESGPVDQRRTVHVFEFINVDIGMKLQITAVDYAADFVNAAEGNPLDSYYLLETKEL